MTCWGSFTPEAYQKFSSGQVDPMNEMVVAPALRSRAAQAPSSFMMDEYEDEEDEYEDEEEYENEDTNASMAMGQLRAMAEDIMLILSQLSDGEEIAPWVASKITMSKQNLSAVSDYLRFSDEY
jgi:hypothetical protein